jgi:hypothetical protein
MTFDSRKKGSWFARVVAQARVLLRPSDQTRSTGPEPGGFLRFNFDNVAEGKKDMQRRLGNEKHFVVFLARGLHGDSHFLT